MYKKDDTRSFRMIPLRERNWMMMGLTFIGSMLTLLATILLFQLAIGSNDIWLWSVTVVMALASLLSLLALVSGDASWFLISLLVSWQN